MNLFLLVIAGSVVNAQTFTVLYAFQGGADGASPNGVILDSAGNLYVADSQNHRVQKLIRKESVALGQSSLAKLDLPAHVSRVARH